jgi:hypothetical protein
MDMELVKRHLDEARRSLNNAANAYGEWESGRVANVPYTIAQQNALKAAVLSGLQKGKVGIAAVENEIGR